MGSHNFGEPKWTWAKDNKSATATFTCGTCKKRVTEEAKVTEDVPTGSSCGAPGEVKYTALVTFEEKTYSDFKIEQILIDHTLIYFPKVSAKCETDGNEEYWECSVCKKLFSDVAGSKEITSPTVILAAGHTLELVKDKLYKCTVCNGTFTVSPDGTTRMYSVEEDTVILQDETENDTDADYSDEENQNEAETIIEDSPSQTDSEENEQDDESMLNEQREEDGQNEDESSADILDVPENAARYGLISPEEEGERINSVTADTWEESTVNLRAESTGNSTAQTVQAQQQQGYPLWVSITVLAVLAGMVMFFILRRKDNR